MTTEEWNEIPEHKEQSLEDKIFGIVDSDCRMSLTHSGMQKVSTLLREAETIYLSKFKEVATQFTKWLNDNYGVENDELHIPEDFSEEETYNKLYDYWFTKIYNK